MSSRGVINPLDYHRVIPPPGPWTPLTNERKSYSGYDVEMPEYPEFPGYEEPVYEEYVFPQHEE